MKSLLLQAAARRDASPHQTVSTGRITLSRVPTLVKFVTDAEIAPKGY